MAGRRRGRRKRRLRERRRRREKEGKVGEDQMGKENWVSFLKSLSFSSRSKKEGYKCRLCT